MIVGFGRDVTGRLASAESKEWLCTKWGRRLRVGNAARKCARDGPETAPNQPHPANRKRKNPSPSRQLTEGS